MHSLHRSTILSSSANYFAIFIFNAFCTHECFLRTWIISGSSICTVNSEGVIVNKIMGHCVICLAWVAVLASGSKKVDMKPKGNIIMSAICFDGIFYLEVTLMKTKTVCLFVRETIMFTDSLSSVTIDRSLSLSGCFNGNHCVVFRKSSWMAYE